MLMLLSMMAPLTRLIEVRCIRPDSSESTKTFEHQHLNNANMLVASAGLTPANHVITFVETVTAGATIGLGDGSTMANVVEALNSNLDIGAITIHIAVNAAAAGVHAAGMTSHMHHTAHGGASANFGVAGSSTPMNIHPQTFGQMPPGTFVGHTPHAMPMPMGVLGYGMPVDHAKGYISGHAGGKKKADKPKAEDVDPKEPKALSYHCAGRMDRNKAKMPHTESYKVHSETLALALALAPLL